MTKRVKVKITDCTEKSNISFCCDVSETSKLSLADWIWFARKKCQELTKTKPTDYIIHYIQPGEKC